MPLETGTYISDLDQSNPPGSDGKDQGDNHLRLIKTVAKQTFPNASKAFRFPTTAAEAAGTVNVVFPDDQNKLFPVNASAAPRIVNLPNPTSGGTVHEDGFSVAVIKTDASANAVTITPSGVQTINGAATLVLNKQWDIALLTWAGTDDKWYAIYTPVTATTGVKGLSRRATATEAQAGVEFEPYIASTHLHSAREDVASGSTTNIGAASSNFVRITGTTTITAFDSAAAGVWRDVMFAGVLTLTHHATNLIIPGGANVVTAANDCMRVRSLGAGAWIVLSYVRASGAPVLANIQPGAIIAIAEDQKTSGTAADGLTDGVDTVRTLNTLTYNRDSIASLASNRLTLPAGTWEIEWTAEISHGSNSQLIGHQSFLYNQSDSAEVARGIPGIFDTRNTGQVSISQFSYGGAVVTIAASKAFEIRHRTNIIAGTNAIQGKAASLGTEVFTRVVVRRA